MDPQTHACDVREFVTRVQLPATVNGPGHKQRASRGRGERFQRQFCFQPKNYDLPTIYFSPALPGEKARRLSPECLRTANGLEPRARAHSRPGLQGEPEESLAPSWRDGDEGEAGASGGGDSHCILSPCSLPRPPPAEASPLGFGWKRRIRRDGRPSEALQGGADPQPRLG